MSKVYLFELNIQWKAVCCGTSAIVVGQQTANLQRECELSLAHFLLQSLTLSPQPFTDLLQRVVAHHHHIMRVRDPHVAHMHVVPFTDLLQRVVGHNHHIMGVGDPHVAHMLVVAQQRGMLPAKLG